MNRQKLLLLCLGATLGVLPAARAEDPTTPPPPAGSDTPPPPPEHGGHRGGGKMEERLIKALNLTPDQETKWKALTQQEMDAGKTIHQDGSLSKEQKWAKMKDNQKTFDAQKRALLNPDQQTKFDEFLAKRAERMQRRRGGEDGAPPPPPPPPPASSSDGK
ncbi:MAG TPA: hypothetical protein VHD32_08000 [Candidatus Didemnitutus sp.]|nr:hypothetical protein [Candidatus Didemnitutus sp.]